ncbi:hypothetical protein G6O69_09505 [Pseudenhygromyxa sp. WMMC2535]|nr:hypothetical protein [Pseudenhygromyxa sp. WMMC2535]
MNPDDELTALVASAPVVLRALGPRASRSKDALVHALVRPLFAALGYDSTSVHTSTIAGVDLTISAQGELRMLVEVLPELAAAPSEALSAALASAGARLGIATDGLVIQVVFVGADTPGVELDLLSLDLAIGGPGRAALAQLSRDGFDPEAIALDAALARVLGEPPAAFVELVHGELHPGATLEAGERARFTRALTLALARAGHSPESADPESAEEPGSGPGSEPGRGEVIVTTEEELAGYALVRELLADVFPLERLGYRDRERFFGIIVDGDERQTLCRLHFNRVRKYIGIFSAPGREKKHRVDDVEAIRGLREPLREAARRWVDSTGAPS